MPAWIVPAAIAAGQLIGGLIGQNRQNKYEKGLARYQADMNQKYLDAQLAYNTPKSQMTRYQDAGLNPHLIYGQGTPGNQQAPLQYPQQRSVDQGAALNALGSNFQNALLVQSQVQATDAKTRQTGVLTQLNELQKAVLARNPLLNEAGFSAIIQSLVSSAEIKAAEGGMKKATAEWFTGDKSFNVNGVSMHGPAGVLKLETELKLLEQRYNLGAADQKVKAEILKSKEFQNTLLDIQAKWMKDAEITPQHILQFIQLLIMKFF